MPTAVIVDAIRTPLGTTQRAARGMAPGRPRRPRARRRSSSATTSIPALVDDVIMGCVSQVGEQALNIGRNALLAAGLPGLGARHHRRPAVRLVAAGAALRRPGRDGRRLRRGRRRRGGEHEPRADGLVGARRRSVRHRVSCSATRSRAAGHLGRAHRRAVGLTREELDEFALELAAARRAGHGRGALRPRDRAGAGHRSTVWSRR